MTIQLHPFYVHGELWEWRYLSKLFAYLKITIDGGQKLLDNVEMVDFLERIMNGLPNPPKPLSHETLFNIEWDTIDGVKCFRYHCNDPNVVLTNNGLAYKD